MSFVRHLYRKGDATDNPSKCPIHHFSQYIFALFVHLTMEMCIKEGRNILRFSSSSFFCSLLLLLFGLVLICWMWHDLNVVDSFLFMFNHKITQKNSSHTLTRTHNTIPLSQYLLHYNEYQDRFFFPNKNVAFIRILNHKNGCFAWNYIVQCHVLSCRSSKRVDKIHKMRKNSIRNFMCDIFFFIYSSGLSCCSGVFIIFYWNSFLRLAQFA